MRRSVATSTSLIVFFCFLAWLVASPLIAQPVAGSQPELRTSLFSTSPEVLGGGDPPLGDGCEDAAVIKDDGIPESGFGWVPSAIFGVYAQVYEPSEFVQQAIDEVCICFLRNRNDDSIDFEVVFYADDEGQPAAEPFAAIPAFLDGVPDGAVFGPLGKFARVSTAGVRPPATGPFYIGARWNPSVDQGFFVCDDQSPTTERVNIWFIDDRAEDWDNADETNDPIFIAHRGLFVRPVGSLATAIDVPLMDGRGLVLLAAVLLGAGLWVLRRSAP